MFRLFAFTIALLFSTVALPPSAPAIMRFGDGPTLVWVKIEARRGEDVWQACRRVYQRDVYQVRRGRDGVVWCHIEHHRLYDNDRRRRNYNLR